MAALHSMDKLNKTRRDATRTGWPISRAHTMLMGVVTVLVLCAIWLPEV